MYCIGYTGLHTEKVYVTSMVVVTAALALMHGHLRRAKQRARLSHHKIKLNVGRHWFHVSSSCVKQQPSHSG